MLNLDVFDDLNDVQEAGELLLNQANDKDIASLTPAILIASSIILLAKEIKLTRERDYSRGEEISNTAESLMRIGEAISQLAKRK